jgi:hypothetical protein
MMVSAISCASKSSTPPSNWRVRPIPRSTTVLGDRTYESLARNGEGMTTAAMATYAHDQIDRARAELNAVSK